MYLLRVKGVSMIDAGIHEGDLLLVERTDVANVGNIVVANVDSEWTVKYLREKKGKKYLEAANEDYPDIFPETSLKIGGVVRSVIRTYDK
jgi:repressor LexA